MQPEPQDPSSPVGPHSPAQDASRHAQHGLGTLAIYWLWIELKAATSRNVAPGPMAAILEWVPTEGNGSRGRDLPASEPPSEHTKGQEHPLTDGFGIQELTHRPGLHGGESSLNTSLDLPVELLGHEVLTKSKSLRTDLPRPGSQRTQ